MRRFFGNAWLRHGVLNTLEHFLARGSDAIVTLILVWWLAPEEFARLALAQAWAGPTLFAFISLENGIYRDFAEWRTKGASFAFQRIRAFRAFSWAKALLGLVFSIGFALFHGPGLETFFAMIWAYCFHLAPQIVGPDREYLRVQLRLPALNLHTVFQKASLVFLTFLATWKYPGSIFWLSMASFLSLGFSAILANRLVKMYHVDDGLPSSLNESWIKIVLEMLSRFGIWHHANGVVLAWFATLDVLLLGYVKTPAAWIGLYATVLKLSNFIPIAGTALASLMMMWLGRRQATGRGREVKVLALGASAMAMLSAVAAAIFYLFGAPILRLLSRGRWNAADQLQMMTWLIPCLSAAVLFSVSLMLATWLYVRADAKKLFLWVYLTWFVLGSGLMVFASQNWGVAGVAWSRSGVYAVYCILLILRIRS